MEIKPHLNEFNLSLSIQLLTSMVPTSAQKSLEMTFQRESRVFRRESRVFRSRQMISAQI